MAIEERKMMSVPNFEVEFQNRIASSTNALDVLIELFEKDKEIQRLFKNRDKKQLFTLLEPIYQKLNEKMDITHLYFLDREGKVILRVHDVDRHSDIIDRYTFKQAKLLGKSFSGIEFGIKKNFTLRNVHPWIVEGELIGYIELGKEIDKMMNAISNVIDVEIFMAVKKDIYTDVPQHVEERLEHYSQFDNYYIVYNTIAIPDTLEDLFEFGMNTDLHLAIDKKYYHTSSLLVKDVKQMDIGYLIFFTDATFERELFIRIMLILFVSATIITLGLIIGWKILSQNREGQINNMTKNLEKIAVTDEMTDLYNRKYFNEQGVLEINRANREGLCFSMLMMDIDFFKRYNDTYGHQAGDEAIKTVAKLIKETFQRASDLSFRVGGEEFAVLVTHNENEDLLLRANGLRESLISEAIAHSKNDAARVLTLSIGLVTCKSGNIDTLDLLYKKADESLYEAKERGRNQVVVYKNKELIG